MGTVKWLQVSAGKSHTCGSFLRGAAMELACWGDNSRGQTVPPPGFYFLCHPSCATCTGIQNTDCTSCRKGMHHTVLNTLQMAGTCTKTFCPLCKPKQCCGPNHKHFVMAAESMQGVCVRHTDQCQPLCIPQANTLSKAAPARRVCSK